MSGILSFFLAGPTAPARLQVLLIGALAIGAACLGLFTWGLWWRGEAREAKAVVAVYAAQVQVSSAALNQCNAGADEARRVGNAAIAAMGGLVADARKAGEGARALAGRLDELAREPRQPGQDCHWAWQQIEQQYQQNRKARPTP